MTSPWQSRMDNAIGGVAAAFICWAVATGIDYIAHPEPIEASIETLSIQNPLFRSGAPALALRNYILDAFKVDTLKPLSYFDRFPGADIAILHINNRGKTRSKEVEVSFPLGIIIFPDKGMIEPPAKLKIDAIEARSGIDIYVLAGFVPGQPPKPIFINVDGKPVDIIDMRLIQITRWDLHLFVFDNQWLTVIFAAIGIVATFYFLGFVGAKLYRFARPKIAKLLVVTSPPPTGPVPAAPAPAGSTPPAGPAPAPTARASPVEQSTTRSPPRRDLN